MQKKEYHNKQFSDHSAIKLELKIKKLTQQQQNTHTHTHKKKKETHSKPHNCMQTEQPAPE